MIIDGYQREDMFKDLLKDLNKDLNSIQIPTPVDINESSTKQIVYKIDGDLNGNIKGDNVTVILMGDGNINGDIESKDGEIVLIKGDINGDVKANKIICPDKPSNEKWVAPSTYSKTKKEEPEISNYLSVHPVYIECPKCHHSFDKKLRVDASVVNNKVLHTMITPISHESSYY